MKLVTFGASFFSAEGLAHSKRRTFLTFLTLYNSRTTFLVQVMYYNEFVQLMYYIKEFQITYYVVHYSLWPSFVFLEFDILQKMYFIYLTLYKSRTTFLFSFIQYKKILRISKQEFLQCLPPLSYFFQFFGSVFLTF